MRISDWSSYVCSSDLVGELLDAALAVGNHGPIGDIDGERLIEAEARRLAARDRLAELLGAFASQHHRHQPRKVQRAPGADAAIAERERGCVERAFRRRAEVRR